MKKFLLATVALVALGATAFFVRQFEHQITALRVAARAFDLSAEAVVAASQSGARPAASLEDIFLALT